MGRLGRLLFLSITGLSVYTSKVSTMAYKEQNKPTSTWERFNKHERESYKDLRKIKHI